MTQEGINSLKLATTRSLTNKHTEEKVSSLSTIDLNIHASWLKIKLGREKSYARGKRRQVEHTRKHWEHQHIKELEIESTRPRERGHSAATGKRMGGTCPLGKFNVTTLLKAIFYSHYWNNTVQNTRKEPIVFNGKWTCRSELVREWPCSDDLQMEDLFSNTIFILLFRKTLRWRKRAIKIKTT